MKEIICLFAVRPDWLVISRHTFSQSDESKAKYDFRAGDFPLFCDVFSFWFCLTILAHLISGFCRFLLAFHFLFVHEIWLGPLSQFLVLGIWASRSWEATSELALDVLTHFSSHFTKLDTLFFFLPRPGCFCTHTYKSVTLLLDVLSELKEWDTLLLIQNLLYRTPEQGKWVPTAT